jgi:ribulose-bisphosphate carboxylase large chain
MVRATRLLLMSDRIVVTYVIHGDSPKAVAEAIAVEQSIEFPPDLAPQWIRDEVVGSIDHVGPTVDSATEVVISYDHRNSGGELPQLINLLWGNVAMLPGVKVVDIALPDVLLKAFRGPRFGVSGLREMFDAPTRGLVSAALKPMGASTEEFAENAKILALAGFDTVKDDHSLVNQPWSTWRDRVARVSEAVREANEITGGRCVYAPSMNLPAGNIVEAAHEAKALGAGALLVLPGISGFDMMRTLADDDELALPIMGHPSLLGSLTTSVDHGLAHDLVFGLLQRLAGADISIFINYGARFTFTKDQCRAITQRAREPLGELRPMWVSPAGGMTLERIDEMLNFYGADTAALMAGALHRGSLRDNASVMVEAIHAYQP